MTESRRARLLQVRDLRVRFETHEGVVRAVDGLSFTLDEGETLGIVGESGSGKSVTSLAVMGLVPSPPGVVEAEAIEFGGRDLLRMPAGEQRALRGREIAMVFQDPMTSLNPLMTIGRQMCEVLEVHEGRTRRAARQIAAAALADVGIANPAARLDSYPHQLSGGMRQRVMIAMALLCKPKLLFADEPTTALDVTIQAQILDLLRDLQRKHGTAIVLITHSLGVVAGAADRVLVMYAGRVVESAETRALFTRPLHPYTLGLLHSVPRIAGDLPERLPSIPGQPPDPSRLGRACSFRPRCPFAIERCEREAPLLEAPAGTVGSDLERVQRSACFLKEELARGKHGAFHSAAKDVLAGEVSP
jgi:oligopeptide transport system ATP-binding protein